VSGLVSGVAIGMLYALLGFSPDIGPGQQLVKRSAILGLPAGRGSR
jgi:hypothetical protein